MRKLALSIMLMIVTAAPVAAQESRDEPVYDACYGNGAGVWFKSAADRDKYCGIFPQNCCPEKSADPPSRRPAEQAVPKTEFEVSERSESGLFMFGSGSASKRQSRDREAGKDVNDLIEVKDAEPEDATEGPSDAPAFTVQGSGRRSVPSDEERSTQVHGNDATDTPEVNSDDRDNDGLDNISDPCADAAEDFDGFEDHDGCPDKDNDEDGLNDTEDACPDTAGFADADEPGCRYADTDGDGVDDGHDLCPEDAAPDSVNGCPDDVSSDAAAMEGDGTKERPRKDQDGDGVTDDEDGCPEKAEDLDGFEDDDGCPDSNNDGDLYPDARDRCPSAPETVNDFEDDDGCPDTVPEEDALVEEGNASAGATRSSRVSAKGGETTVRRGQISDAERRQMEAERLAERHGRVEQDETADDKESSRDTDEDGVDDLKDHCPSTSPGVLVDEKGCSVDRREDPEGCKKNDGDCDGVKNRRDACPNTPRGEEVHRRNRDLRGCSDSQLDSDGDGVMDDEDSCPATPGSDLYEGCPSGVTR